METGWALKCGQRDALPHAQIHISSRHRSRRKRNPSASSPAGGPVGRGQKRSRVDRLRQSQSRQDHDGIVRSRFDGPFDRRTVQDHGRRRLRSRAVSWCGAGFERSSRRTSRDIVCWDRRIDRVHQDRKASCAGGLDGNARGSATGCSDRERISAGLRSRRLARARCAQRHAGRHHRAAQQGDRCGAGRSQHQGALRGSGRHRCLRSRRANSASSLPTKRRSGARWFGRPTSGWNRHPAEQLICSQLKPLRDFHGWHNETPTKTIPVVVPWRWCISSRFADSHG